MIATSGGNPKSSVSILETVGSPLDHLASHSLGQHRWRRRIVRLAAGWTLAVTVLLAALLLARAHASANLLNGFTLVTAAASAAVAWASVDKAAGLGFASLLLFSAALPAMYGLLGLLYLPGLLLLLIAVGLAA